MSHHEDWRRRADAIEKSAIRILDDKLFAASWERMVCLACLDPSPTQTYKNLGYAVISLAGNCPSHPPHEKEPSNG